MVDIHSHILWGLDDGARDLPESIAMVEMAAAGGTTDIVATSHANSQFAFDPVVVSERVRELEAVIGNVPRIHRGCDFHLSLENMQQALKDRSRYTINGLNYLLVEFSEMSIPPSAEEVFRQFVSQGISPVITHPERNLLLQEATERLQRWVGMGCLLQVTALSLTDRFGKRAQRSAWTLLRKGLVHVIASDGHDTEQRPPRLDVARDLLTREFGAGLASLLTGENPAAIVSGQAIEAPATSSLRKWYQFWK